MTFVNKVKSLTARATMASQDVRSLLEKDHDEAKELLEKLLATTQSDRRLSLLERLKTALTAHSRAEESAVYNAMLTAKSPDSRDLANEGYVEHGIVDQLLADLATGDPSGSRWLATAKVLQELLEQHINEEQTDTFAELGEHFNADELRAMGTAFLHAKTAAMKSKSVARVRKGPRKAATRTSARTPTTKRARAGARSRNRTQSTAKKSSRAR